MTVSVIATCFTSLAIGTGFERRSGALTFLATTPLSRVDLLLGKAIATGALAAMSIAVLAIAAAIMGWRPDAQWPVLALFVVVGGGAFAALAVLLAGILRAAGYATGGFGKWGLGPPGSAADPLACTPHPLSLRRALCTASP